MGCNCGKKKSSAQPTKIVKTPTRKQVPGQTNSLKRVIKRTTN